MKIKLIAKETRYIHSLNVMEESKNLQCIIMWIQKKAGLLHDCAKNISKKDENELIKKYRMKPMIYRETPVHCYIVYWACISQRKYQVSDENIECLWHTTGVKTDHT